MAKHSLALAGVSALLALSAFTSSAQAVENHGGWKHYYYKYAYSHVRDNGQARTVDRHINGHEGRRGASGRCDYLLDRFYETGRSKWRTRYEDCRGW